MSICQQEKCTSKGEITCSCNFKLKFCGIHSRKHCRLSGNHNQLIIEEEFTSSRSYYVKK